MNQQKIIDELISIEAFADELKKKATGLRAYLARVDGPAPKGAPLSPEEKEQDTCETQQSNHEKK